MSSNPQWKSSFQPPDHMNQDSAIIDFKPMTSNNKPSQAFNFSTNRSTNSRFGQDFSILQDNKTTFTNDLYGNNTTTTTSTNNSRFPPIGTFSLDTNNMFNNSNNSGGDNTLSNNVFSNGNTSSSNYQQDSANSANLGTRETGIIEKLLHSYGFIQCCERQARLFFHFSQFRGNIEHLKIGDPVEFEMTYDRRTGKPIASAVTKIAPEVVMSEERVTGTVTTEVRTNNSNNENGTSSSNGGSSNSGNHTNGGTGGSGDTTGRISYENRGECFFLPYTKDDVEGNVILRSGDKVSFQIATNNRGNLGACHVRLENPVHPVKYQGVVCSMKESFGFIERADVVKEIFFHFSEAKTKEELRLGDDVEFTIQTRNSKEVACNIIRLPPGTVIFEDLKPEIIKGQVLKPLDRGPNLRQQQQQQQQQIDALPGRIRYRSQLDHSEVEISFGDKDQNGDFTLRHGDWVQFKIATDRRDGLNRATNIQLLDESFLVSGEKRECGIVIAIKDGYGFLKCVERDARVFFHFNEILDVEHELKLGDEFEFTLIQEQQLINQSFQQQNQRQCAIRMKLLPIGTVQFEQRLENNLIGYIIKDIPQQQQQQQQQQSSLNNWLNRSPIKTMNDLNDCYNDSVNGLITYTNASGLKRTICYYLKDCDLKFPPPKLGDKVQFNVNQIKRNKELIAVNVQVQQNGIKQMNKCGQQIYQGFIAALKDGFGFIETNEHDKEVFFHFSNFEGDPNLLELGQEVEYNLNIQNNNLNKSNNGNLSGTCSSAENVKLIPKGTITQAATICSDILNGIVIRPLRSVNPDQNEYSGLIRLIKNQDDSDEQLKIDENNLNDNLIINNVNNVDGDDNDDDNGDEEFEFGIMGLMNKRELLQIGDFVQFQIDSSGRAVNIQAQRKKLRATVDAIKGHFGFLTYELDDGKKLFFHMTEVKDNSNLQIGDTVEFVLVTNHRSGKSSACSVVKVSDVQARPERLISRLRTVSMDDAGPKLIVIRQPKGPDGSRGFTTTNDSRGLQRLPGILNE